jgi:two-component system, cell cycle sensor histidine kinase and response regulator CckA
MLLSARTDLQTTLLVGAILIIDDDLGIREALTDILKFTTNRMVFTAANGSEGVEIVRDQRPNISLIILDMNMPLMNGEQTYAKLQQIAPEVKVIVSSSLSHAEVARRFAPHPLPPMLQKPYQVDILSSMVSLILG